LSEAYSRFTASDSLRCGLGVYSYSSNCSNPRTKTKGPTCVNSIISFHQCGTPLSVGFMHRSSVHKKSQSSMDSACVAASSSRTSLILSCQAETYVLRDSNNANLVLSNARVAFFYSAGLSYANARDRSQRIGSSRRCRRTSAIKITESAVPTKSESSIWNKKNT